MITNPFFNFIPLLAYAQQEYGDLSFSAPEVLVISGMLAFVLGGVSVLFKMLISTKDDQIKQLVEDKKDMLTLLKTSAVTSEKQAEAATKTISVTDDQLKKIYAALMKEEQG